MESPREWYRDGFLISDDKDFFQLSAINAVFASDLLYWTKAMSEEALKKMISKSLCFGVYALPSTNIGISGCPYTSFANKGTGTNVRLTSRSQRAHSNWLRATHH
jgi:hypothetical protein